jgi:hypothetical protein
VYQIHQPVSLFPLQGEESLRSAQLIDSGMSLSSRFDLEHLVPSSCIVHLNEINSTEQPLFVVHPIEGKCSDIGATQYYRWTFLSYFSQCSGLCIGDGRSTTVPLVFSVSAS